jgi:hypothetical protein
MDNDFYPISINELFHCDYLSAHIKHTMYKLNKQITPADLMKTAHTYISGTEHYAEHT